MIASVAVRELLREWRLWVGSFVVIAATAAILSAVISQFATAAALTEDQSDSLLSMTRGMLVFTLLAGVAVASSTTNLAVASGRRGYALLQIAGVLPRQVTAIVATQLVILALFATALGLGGGVLAARPLLGLASQEAELPGLTVVFDLKTVLWSAAVMIGVVLLSGARGAFRAGTVPPVEALRDAEPAKIKMGVARWIAAGVAALFVIVFSVALSTTSQAASFSGEDPNRAMAISGVVGLGQLLAIALTAFVAALAPMIYPLVLRSWTACIPVGLSTSWFLARRGGKYRITLSSAAVTPLMVGIALTGSLYTLFLTVGGAMAREGRPSWEINHASIFTLLGPALFLAALGAAAVIFMTNRTRTRDNALVEVSGGTSATLGFMAILETIIYVGTALIIGALVFGVIGLAASGALTQMIGQVAPVFGVGVALVVAASGILLIGIATVIPTFTGHRRTIPAALSS
ncbi:FtsX-like permease family protein [Leucobacter sp. NPDC058333]|uniref:FtsX-like permease family protein n=1 Tax=Leucobacter sp. NPDC058333 TaxID=3346450 RepID=UPI00364B7BD5